MRDGLEIWIVCTVASGSIASSKGNSYWGGFALGFLLGPLGLLIVVLMARAPVSFVIANQVVPGRMKSCTHEQRTLLARYREVCNQCGQTFTIS